MGCDLLADIRLAILQSQLELSDVAIRFSEDWP
jgi:hypothetical protein